MSEKKTHDLYQFMKQLTNEIAEEYNRIQMRATEDPGTAGDQGEENWAELLRDWLPRTYEVVTKGRIISQDGRTSPQVDILVLKSIYPEKLLNKKLYLAAGVAAAFECKTTLKAAHIDKAMETCVKIKNLYPNRVGTPYKELHVPIVYGLLAHSHSWQESNSTPEDTIRKKLLDSDELYVPHPCLGLDLLCVADLAAWTSFKETLVLPQITPDKIASSTYLEHAPIHEKQVEYFTPIGALVYDLSQRLAWEDPALRDLADYYRITNIAGSAEGILRLWSTSIYSTSTQSRVEMGDLSNDKAWTEWNLTFP